MKHKHLTSLFLIISFTTFDVSHAKSSHYSFSVISDYHRTFNSTHPWKIPSQLEDKGLQFLLAGVLSFIAAAISSAGGIGGGGLFIPILTVVAGFDLKMASAYSAFMVTGGSIANVGSQIFAKRSGKSLIDYDIALLSEPCMLLGVSCGVICNLMFPEWLITMIFAVFLAFCTFKTCKSGVSFWKLESEGGRINGCLKMENEEAGESTKMPLLSVDEGKFEIPLMKLGMLVLIWFSFFILYLLRGNRYGQGIIDIEACGTGYWIISFIQIPLAIIFTTWILRCRKSLNNTAAAAEQEREGEATNHLYGNSSNMFLHGVVLLNNVCSSILIFGHGEHERCSNLCSRLFHCLISWFDVGTTSNN
ncbi:hypothetical protein ACS0TY_018489 [Phlomoides rotata]